MAEKNYREKIKKLLALSESSNENEAKSALLKAKKLMAEYKIAETDLEDMESRKIRRINTGYDCSKRREAWMIYLAELIASNFCCRSYSLKEYDKQLMTICFVGLDGDVDACEDIFKYAVECIRGGIKDLKKKNAMYSAEYRKKLCDGYGFGYVSGINQAFAEQKKQDETGWGLVMTTPKEVNDEISGMRKVSYKSAAQENMSRKAFHDGREDGKKFDPGTKIKGGRSDRTAIGCV